MNRKIISGTPAKILAFISTGLILINQFKFLSFYSCLPFILLDLYIFIFYKKFKASLLIPAVFGCLAFIQFITLYRHFFQFGLFGNTDLRFIGFFILLFLFIAACINSSMDFKYKFITPVVVIAAMLIYIYIFFDVMNATKPYFKEFGFYYITYYSAYLIFFITLLLFLMKNKVRVKLETQNPYNLPAEKALPLLKEQFEYGMYSEEDYNKKRAEIISKL